MSLTQRVKLRRTESLRSPLTSEAIFTLCVEALIEGLEATPPRDR
jgi:hypothetical protein